MSFFESIVAVRDILVLFKEFLGYLSAAKKAGEIKEVREQLTKGFQAAAQQVKKGETKSMKAIQEALAGRG